LLEYAVLSVNPKEIHLKIVLLARGKNTKISV
jgi:hypothetical protein